MFIFIYVKGRDRQEGFGREERGRERDKRRGKERRDSDLPSAPSLPSRPHSQHLARIKPGAGQGT